MERKDFLRLAAASTMATAAGVTTAFGSSLFTPARNPVFTVTGSIPAEKLGVTLIHEHIVDIFGTPPEEPASYDKGAVLKEVVPYLKYLKEIGVTSIVDCSAQYLGRNAGLLKLLSEKSGIQIVISTGVYGAADDRYVPEYAHDETPEKLAGRWIEEFGSGIQDTGVKPGFVKIGVDNGPLSDIDAKLVRAAAITHLETGLLLQIHTADNPQAVDRQLDILSEEGVSPEAWVWVHAQAMDSPGKLLEAANRGAWISLDGLRTQNYFNGYPDGSNTLTHHLKLVKAFKEEGLLNRVLLSHDGAAYPPLDYARRPMDVLITSFIPMLKAAGFTNREIEQITVRNPAKAFGIKVRKL